MRFLDLSGPFFASFETTFFSLKWLKIIYLGKNTLKNTRIFANELDNGLEICDLFDFFGHQGGRKGCLNFYYYIDL